MKLVLKFEELFLFLFGFYLFMNSELLSWWWFFVLLLLPDIGMFGYILGKKTGAIVYNIFHHRGLAIALYLLGISALNFPALELTGIMMFSHIAMDRLFGYGLKYQKGFKYTHLGEIGNKNG